MAYQFSANQTPLTGAESIYNLKTTLKAAGWTVPRSSDGTTYNSSGDQISSPSTGANGMANNNAWFVIQQPGAVDGYTRQLCIQRDSNNTNWRIKYAVTAAFTGGSPSATQTPSSTDEQIILGTGTDASPTFTQLFTTDNTYRYNVAADNASPYSFWAAGWQSGNASGNGIQTVFFMDGLLSGSASAQDNDPYMFWVTFGSSNLCTTAGTSTVLQVYTNVFNPNTTSISPTGWLRKGLQGAGYMNIPILFYITNNLNNLTIPGFGGNNPHSEGDDLFPAIYHRTPLAGNNAPVGYKGISGLFKLVGAQRQIGFLFTVSTPGDYVCIGQIALPWNGSYPLV